MDKEIEPRNCKEVAEYVLLCKYFKVPPVSISLSALAFWKTAASGRNYMGKVKDIYKQIRPVLKSVHSKEKISERQLETFSSMLGYDISKLSKISTDGINNIRKRLEGGFLPKFVVAIGPDEDEEEIEPEFLKSVEKLKDEDVDITKILAELTGGPAEDSEKEKHLENINIITSSPKNHVHPMMAQGKNENCYHEDCLEKSQGGSNIIVAPRSKLRSLEHFLVLFINKLSETMKFASESVKRIIKIILEHMHSAKRLMESGEVSPTTGHRILYNRINAVPGSDQVFETSMEIEALLVDYGKLLEKTENEEKAHAYL